jgi:hypothetical protein
LQRAATTINIAMLPVGPKPMSKWRAADLPNAASKPYISHANVRTAASTYAVAVDALSPHFKVGVF